MINSMKRKLFLLLSLTVTLIANAQIARWLIQPSYDNIYMVSGIDAVLTDSVGMKTLWSFEGKKLLTISDSICPFKEKRAISIKPGTNKITGIIKDNGAYIKVDNCNTTYQYPYFSCGKLLVQSESFYRYLDFSGKISKVKFTTAYPFFNGYATCSTFEDWEKQKDPYFMLIDKHEEIVLFSFNGKTFSQDDIDFISSVNDENVGIVVIKKRVYYFDGKQKLLSPVFAKDAESNLKEQAKLKGDIEECITSASDSTTQLVAKCGKTSTLLIKFDSMLRPISITVGGKEKRYSSRIEEKTCYTSPLKIQESDKLYGIYWQQEEILPPQFDSIVACFNNKALVKLNGKFGMLAIDKESKFRLRLNKGNDVAFLHQKFETMIRVDMPTIISSDETYLEIDRKSGCDLDKTSRRKKDTESGNFVEYNCSLNIPENLPDEIVEISYPVQILYNGLKSPIVQHKVNAWFYKKFEVEEDESQRSLSQGTLTFVFNIKNVQSDGNIYKTDVSVLADTLKVEREDKMSETRYKYKVYGLNEGVNNVVIQIVEQGCPPVSFPFEVEYHKPVAKTKNKPAEVEKVTIKRKPKVKQKTEKLTPRLEI